MFVVHLQTAAMVPAAGTLKTKKVSGLELISRISQIWDLLLDCCADCGICHLARLCMALLSCGEVCGGPALKPAWLP